MYTYFISIVLQFEAINFATTMLVHIDLKLNVNPYMA